MNTQRMLPEHLKFSHLKRTVSIETVLHHKGVAPLRNRGHQLVGPCPVHGGDNPNAFVVNLSKNVWHCFTRCNGGGDVIDLVRRMDNMTYYQTAQYLTSLSHESTPASIPLKNPQSETSFKPFARSLPLNYKTSWLKGKGITEKTASLFEAGLYQGTGFLSDCIGVRLHDLNGSPIGYAGRRIISSQVKNYGKWKFPVRLPKNDILYNFHRVRSMLDKGLFLVEGPWGVMRLAQLNIPAVALLGINLSLKQHQILRNVPKVVLMLDGDDPGRNAADRIRKTLSQFTIVKQVHLITHTDPDDFDDHQLARLANLLFS